MQTELQDKHDLLVNRILEIVNEEDRPFENIKDCVRTITKGYATDMLNLFKNITETSLTGSDYDQRIHDLCIRFGITKSGDTFF